MISGDFNINFFELNDNKTKKLINILNSLKFFQLINDPTYPLDPKYSSNPSLIDLLITNEKTCLIKYVYKIAFPLLVTISERKT